MKVTSDLHVHTNLSLCAYSDALATDYLRDCPEKGITTIGFSNHCWAESVFLEDGVFDWYKKQPEKYVLSIHELIPKDTNGVKVLVGCETEFLGGNVVGMDKDTASLFDYVLVPASHFHLNGFTVPADFASSSAKTVRELLYRRFNEALELEVTTGIAHPFIPCGFTEIEKEILSGITCKQYENSFNTAASRKVSIEIHNHMADSKESRDEFIRMMTIAKECGCIFHFGSDTHHKLIDYESLGQFADLCGITEEDMMKI